jgi:4-hydroxybenzoate polyprenyltransferase
VSWNSRKTIGVFIQQVNEEFQDALSCGIITKAQELNYNVAFFTNFGGYGQENYDKGEVKIAGLPNYEELEGIILAPDIMELQNLKERYIHNIKTRSHCPVVSVRREMKDFYNVLIDDYTVLDEIITHFIEQHGFTRINFLSGPKGYPDTDKRLANYKKILTESALFISLQTITAVLIYPNKMTKNIRDYANLVKFEHTVFALPFALIGFFLALKSASADFSVLLILKVLGCMVFARNSAMGFNRYLDRHYDAANPRTAKREIPAGIVSPRNALIFVIINSLAFCVICWFINPLCFYLAPVALFVILGYSFTKRITPLCHFVLSSGLALAPIGAYLAVTGKFDLIPLLFSMAVFFWVSGFDIIYACQDIDFDKKYKLKSIPAMIGIKRALQLSAITHLFTFLFVVYAGIVLTAGFLYWLGVLIFTGLLIFQHAIVKPNDLSRVNLSFGTTNGIASILLAVFVIASFYYL